MDGINKKDRFQLPPPPLPPPPRSRVAPSTLVLPLSSSQLGRQYQLTTQSGGGNRSFPEGLNNARDPQPDPNLDDRRLRRLLSNRISAQRSRLRRTNYINEMETQVKEFEAQIAQLSPEVILIQRKKKLLQLDNELMKQKETTLKEHMSLKNAETEAHQTELYHLRQLFELQKQGWMAAWASEQEDYIANQGMYQGRLAQNMYQPWAQQQFANPNMRQPSGSEQMENLGISMTELDQIEASEAYKHGQERMPNPGKYQPGGVE